MEKEGAWNSEGVCWWNAGVMRCSNGAFLTEWSSRTEPVIIDMGVGNEPLFDELESCKNPLNQKEDRGCNLCEGSPVEWMNEEMYKTIQGTMSRVVLCLRGELDFTGNGFDMIRLIITIGPK